MGLISDVGLHEAVAVCSDLMGALAALMGSSRFRTGEQRL